MQTEWCHMLLSYLLWISVNLNRPPLKFNTNENFNHFMLKYLLMDNRLSAHLFKNTAFYYYILVLPYLIITAHDTETVRQLWFRLWFSFFFLPYFSFPIYLPVKSHSFIVLLESQFWPQTFWGNYDKAINNHKLNWPKPVHKQHR